METEVPAQDGKRNPLVIVGIVVAVLLCVCVLCAVAVVAIMAIAGPEVGNVFSNIVEGLGTPTP
jgi:hypothetical protein